MCQEDARDTSKEHLRTGFNLRLIHSIHGLSDRVWKSLRIKVSEQIFCLNHWVSTEIQTQDIQDKSKNSNSKEISTTAYGEEYRIYNLGPRYENISTQQLQREKKKKRIQSCYIIWNFQFSTRNYWTCKQIKAWLILC